MIAPLHRDRDDATASPRSGSSDAPRDTLEQRPAIRSFTARLRYRCQQPGEVRTTASRAPRLLVARSFQYASERRTCCASGAHQEHTP